MTRTTLASVMAVAAMVAGCGTPSQPAAPAATTTPAATTPAPGVAPAPAASQDPAAPATATPPVIAAAPSPATASRPAATATTPAPAATSPAASASPAASSVAAAPPTVSAPAAPPAPVYREFTVPSGTAVAIELRTAVASDTSTVEQTVRGTLRRAVVVDGVEVLPAGAPVSGSVTAVERAGRVKGRARLAMRFTSVTIDDDAVRMSTASIARQAAATKGEDAAKIGIGAGAGAVIGAIAGGKKGAVVGGTVGGAAGTGVVLATRGDEVELPVGTALSTTLTQPLVVRVRQP
jgi:hypothetical protein